MDQLLPLELYFDKSVTINLDDFSVLGGFMTVRRPIDLVRLERQEPLCKKIIDKEFAAEMKRLARKMSKINIGGKPCVDRLLTKALIAIFKRADYTVFGPLPDPTKKLQSKNRFYVLSHPNYEEFQSGRNSPTSYKIERERIQGRVILFPSEDGGLEVPIAVGRLFNQVAPIPFELTEDNVKTLGEGVDINRYKSAFADIKTAYGGRKKLTKNGSIAGPRRMREDDASILDADDVESYPALARAKLSRAPKIRYVKTEEWEATALADKIGIDQQMPVIKQTVKLSGTEILEQKDQRDNQQKYFKLKAKRDLLSQKLTCAIELASHEADAVDRAIAVADKQKLAVAKAEAAVKKLKSLRSKLKRERIVEERAVADVAAIPPSAREAYKLATRILQRARRAIAQAQKELGRSPDAATTRENLRKTNLELKRKQVTLQQKEARAQELQDRQAKLRVLFANASTEFAAHEKIHGIQAPLSAAQIGKIWSLAQEDVANLMKKPCVVSVALPPMAAIARAGRKFKAGARHAVVQ